MTRNLLFLTTIFILIIGNTKSQNLPIEKYQKYFNYSILEYKLKSDTTFNHRKLLKELKNDSLDFNINTFKGIDPKDSTLIKLYENLFRLNNNQRIKSDSAFIVGFFSRDVFMDKSYPELLKISTFNSQNFNRMKTSIRNYLINDIQSLHQDLDQIGIKKNKFENINFIMITIGILFLLIICLILFYVNYIKHLSRLYKEIHNLNSKTKHYFSQNEIDLIRRDLPIIKREIENHKNNYSPSGLTHIQEKGYSDPVRIKEANIQIPHSVITKPEYIKYYFSTPNDDGSFLDRNKATEFEQFSKFFLFKIDNTSHNIAYVTIVEDSETQKHILKNYKEYLDAVCNYNTPFFQSANKIITLKSGKAYLEGERWIIKESDKLIVSFQ